MTIKHRSLFFVFTLFSFSLTFCESQEEKTPIIATQPDILEKEHTPNSWDKVSALYLPSIIDTTNKQKILTQFNTPQTQTPDKQQEALKRKESYKLEQALTSDTTDHTGRILAYLANQESSTINLHEESKAIFDDTTYRDINALCGKQDSPETSLFNLVNHTQTISGRAALLDTLYNPLIDIQSLRARQAGIKTLVEDEQLYESIQEKLTTIKNSEHTLFLILNEMSFELISNISDRFYLESVLDLPIISLVKMIPLVSHIDKLPFMKKFNEYACDKLNKKPILLDIVRAQNYLSSTILPPAFFLGLSAYLGNIAYKEFLNNNYWKTTKYSSSCIMPLITSWIVSKEIYKNIVDNLKTETMLHDAVGTLAKMTTALKELQKIVVKNSKLATLSQFQGFKTEAYKSNTELKNLLVIMKDERFKKPTTWKSPKGKMMSAIKFLCTLKYKFVQPYLEVGKLDALMSIATLYKKHATHPNARYHFASYEQQPTPHLALNNFWNPFINPEIVVTNSLELGSKTKHRNILITGPNAGGKSTSLKAAAFAVLLAQTFTISNAETIITPFTKVFTTLNITDTVGKESLYQADKNRIKQVTSTLSSLDSNEKALVISDEMFNSTGASYGAALFYGTLNYIDESLKNTLFAAATHFETLVELEQDSKGSVANFRVEEAILDKDGKLSWTYKIKPGINKQNISFELAQEDGFDPKILAAGAKLLQRHSTTPSA